MNKKFLQIFTFFLLLVVLSAGAAFAQDRVLIRGKVTDKANGEGLIGVSVVEVDRENRVVGGTQTDMNGSYSLTIRNAEGRKLMFTYIGYKNQTVPVGNNAVINAVLEEDAMELGEVVISAQKKIAIGSLNIDARDMTYAYSRVDAKDLESLPVSSIDQALQGRMAGVDIVATSGQPGAGMSIRIRGTASINNSADPLIVVDNIPYETTISADFDFSTADEESYSQLLNISPSDIQDITVLKDAAATAMFGSKGANGVLMITTKTGVIGKPRLSYGFKSTVSVPRNAIPTLDGNEYTSLILEAVANSGTPLNLATYPEFARDPNNPYYYYNYGQNTDWVSAIQKTSFEHEHNFALSGGGERATYRLSVGYLSQDGNIINTSYNRFTTTLNLNYNISDRIKVVANVSYVHGEKKNAYMSDLLGTTYTKMPNQSIYEYTLSGERTPNYFSPATTPQGSFNSADLSKNEKGIYNPVAMAHESKRYDVDDRMRPIFTIAYQILPKMLEYQGNIAFDIGSNKSKGSLPQVATGRPWTENTVNRVQDSDGETFIVQVYNTLSYRATFFEKISINSAVKFNITDKQSDAFKLTSSNTASIYLADPSNPARLQTISSGKSRERQVQATAVASLDFLGRYIITPVLSMDGNSRFGAGYRYGYFPSLSGRWRISDEPYVRELKFLNELSLRLSYGQTGKVPDKNYLFYNQYKPYGYTYLDVVGIYPGGMELENLRWEKTGEWNFGADFIAWNNRVSIDANWYRKRTDDLMFAGVGIPSVSGVSTIYMNVGSMENRGWELNVKTYPYRAKGREIGFNFVLSRNQNMIISLSDNVTNSTIPTPGNDVDYMKRIQVGNPLGSFYGYRYDGVYLNQDQTIARDAYGNKIYTYTENNEKIPVQMRYWANTVDYDFQPGDAKYGDINNDGSIDEMDIIYLGNANPLLVGGFGPSLKYNNWSFDMYFNFRYKFDIVNSTKREMEKMYDFNNQSTAVLRRWTQPYENPEDAPDDLLPRALYRMGYNSIASSRYVEDGTFMKFKSMTLRYSFDKNLVSRAGLSAANLSFTVYDLYTWTNYTGMNPEVSIRNTATKESEIYSVGYDKSKAPANIRFMLGLNLTF